MVQVKRRKKKRRGERVVSVIPPPGTGCRKSAEGNVPYVSACIMKHRM